MNLRDICKINMGQSPESTSYNSDKQGVPFYQGNADFGALYPNPRIWCSKPIKLAKENDILISVRAPVGALNFSKEECCIGRGLAAITLDSNDFLLEFIYWSLRTGVKELQSKSTGSTFKSINKKTLEEVRIPKISLKEQKDIIRNLTLLTNILAKYKHEIVFLDELVKARFVEMFGEIEDCDKWESKIWNEVVTIKNGRDYKKVLVSDGGYPVVGTGGEIARASKYLCPENTIVVGRKGSINNPMLMKEKFWNVDTAFGVIPNSDYLHYQYFYYFCKFYNFMKLNKATTLPSTTKADLLKIRINIPPLELQNQFASFVQEIDKSRSRIQKSLEASQELFDSLMQEYFG